MSRTLRTILPILLILAAVAPAGAVSNATVAAAAEAGDLDVVKELLAGGADVNAAQGDGMTALHWAALHDDAEMISLLVYAGAHTGAATRLGAYTPLLVAARQGSAAAVEALLAAGADPLRATANGATPLMLAAASGSAAAVQALLAAGSDPDAVDDAHGQTALMFAAAYDRVEVIATLIEGGANPDSTSAVVDVVEREAALRARARRRAQLEAAEREIDAPPEDEDEDGDEEVEEQEGAAAPAEDETEEAAVEDPELAADLELAGSDPIAAGVTTGAEGQGTAQEEVTDSDDDADDAEEAEPEERPRPLSYGQLVGATGGMTPLLHASRQGHLRSAQALLEMGADVDRTSDGDGTSPLLIATLNGHFDLAMFLLSQGADPNVRSSAGATPLYAAINVQWAPHAFYPQPSPAQQRTSHLELMEALLSAGADPDARLGKKLWYTGYNFDQDGVDAQGATAFWRAAQSGDLEAMKLLVAYGADATIATQVVPRRRLPNGRNADRDLDIVIPEVGDPAVDALQAASGAGYDGNFHVTHPQGRMPAVRYLVEELGFDVNRADDQGYTPLHNAAARGDNVMILFLVEHGADATAVSHAGESTADMANGPVQRIQPFPETVALLESLGSENNDNCVSC